MDEKNKAAENEAPEAPAETAEAPAETAEPETAHVEEAEDVETPKPTKSEVPDPADQD